MDDLPPDDIVAAPVQSRLYIGSMLAEQHRDALLALHVSHILQVRAVAMMVAVQYQHQHEPAIHFAIIFLEDELHHRQSPDCAASPRGIALLTKLTCAPDTTELLDHSEHVSYCAGR